MNAKYQEYLKSGEWKHLRDKKIKQVNYTCDGCGEQYRALEVHHLTYERIGEELLTDLVAFCPICHKKAHGLAQKSKWNLYIKGELDEAPKMLSKEDVAMKAIIDSI